jgi:hypothetical protein
MDPFSQEAVRIYRRYQTEIVEAFALCPWAEQARLGGRVREHVVLEGGAPEQAALRAMAELAADERVEIGLLLFPRVTLPFLEFERFVAGVIRQDAARHELGAAPFAMAAFHPGAGADTGSAERLIPFLRRSPDPTIQLVRTASLERVREGSREGTAFVDAEALATLDFSVREPVPLRERVARANLRTVQRRGIAELEQRFQAIFADRDATYARFGDRDGSHAAAAGRTPVPGS